MDFPPEDQLYGKELIFGRVYGREADREIPFEISRACFKLLDDEGYTDLKNEEEEEERSEKKEDNIGEKKRDEEEEYEGEMGIPNKSPLLLQKRRKKNF